MNHFTAILDYDVGNLKSVTNAMRYLGFDTRITSDPAELERADAIILPGVGAFPDAAEKLRVPGLDKTLLTQAEKKEWLRRRRKSPCWASVWGCSSCSTGERRSVPVRVLDWSTAV